MTIGVHIVNGLIIAHRYFLNSNQNIFVSYEGTATRNSIDFVVVRNDGHYSEDTYQYYEGRLLVASFAADLVDIWSEEEKRQNGHAKVMKAIVPGDTSV